MKKNLITLGMVALMFTTLAFSAWGKRGNSGNINSHIIQDMVSQIPYEELF